MVLLHVFTSIKNLAFCNLTIVFVFMIQWLLSPLVRTLYNGYSTITTTFDSFVICYSGRNFSFFKTKLIVQFLSRFGFASYVSLLSLARFFSKSPSNAPLHYLTWLQADFKLIPAEILTCKWKNFNITCSSFLTFVLWKTLMYSKNDPNFKALEVQVINTGYKL